MSIDNNIHDVGVVLGITDGVITDSGLLVDDILKHKLYAIHIKKKNDALSDSNPHICIGWSSLGDLSSISNKDDLRTLYLSIYPGSSNNKVGQDVGQVWRFIKEANIGDYVIFAEPKKIHLAKIESEYIYDNSVREEQDIDYVNVRKVTWIKKDIDRSLLSLNFHHSLGFAMSFFTVNDYKSAMVDIINDNYQKDDYTEELEDDFEEDLTDYDSISDRDTSGENIIYYGTPGCGKSYYVDDKYTSDGYVLFRTVFHPEYSNTDFVGQLIPKANPKDKSKITYDFKEGIFTEAFKYAYYHPHEKVVLIIEEINRGNASAIFGEIFQLLDRDDNGKSHYFIHNENLASQLNKAANYNIYLPSNLSLVGTMNTSDQNVYTLDTAFKRRWTMVKIKNTFAEMDADVEKNNHKLDYLRELSGMYIPGSSYTWRDFVEKVNNKLSTKAPTISAHSDDKEIGLYFVSKKYLEDRPNIHGTKSKVLFAEKVLMYIWNDIAKTAPNKWFDEKTLDNVLEKFENSVSESLLVFNNDLFPEIISSSDNNSEDN